MLSSLISKKEASMCTWCAQIANFQICKGRVGKRLCMMGLWILLLKFGNQLIIFFDLHLLISIDNLPHLLGCSYLQNSINSKFFFVENHGHISFHKVMILLRHFNVEIQKWYFSIIIINIKFDNVMWTTILWNYFLLM